MRTRPSGDWPVSFLRSVSTETRSTFQEDLIQLNSFHVRRPSSHPRTYVLSCECECTWLSIMCYVCILCRLLHSVRKHACKCSCIYVWICKCRPTHISSRSYRVTDLSLTDLGLSLTCIYIVTGCIAQWQAYYYDHKRIINDRFIINHYSNQSSGTKIMSCVIFARNVRAYDTIPVHSGGFGGDPAMAPIEVANGVWPPSGEERVTIVYIVKLMKCKDFGPPHRCWLRIWSPLRKMAD